LFVVLSDELREDADRGNGRRGGGGHCDVVKVKLYLMVSIGRLED
jgi:hypothetical protein